MSGTLSGVYAPTYPTRTDADLKLQREKEGRCALCGLQTHKIKKSLLARSIKKYPLTIEGEVYRGRCLLCFPIRVDDAQAVAVGEEEEEEEGGGGIVVEAMQVAQQEEVLEAEIVAAELYEEQQEEAAVAVQLVTPLEDGEQQQLEELSIMPPPQPSAPPMSASMTCVTSHEPSTALHEQQQQPQPFRIIVASKSNIKLGAVSQAFSQISSLSHPPHVIQGVNIPSTSALPAEPMGKREIVSAALLRINMAKQQQMQCNEHDHDHHVNTIWIGIQSGIVNATELPNDYDYDNPPQVPTRRCKDMYDVGCIVLQRTTVDDYVQPGKQFVVWTDALAIPNPLPLGMKPGPNGEWSELKDPHSVLTDGSRSKLDYLRDGLFSFLEGNDDLFV